MDPEAWGEGQRGRVRAPMVDGLGQIRGNGCVGQPVKQIETERACRAAAKASRRGLFRPGRRRTTMRHGRRASVGAGLVSLATPARRPLRLGGWARVFALAIAMLAAAWLLYQLLDVVLLVFRGITLAAALQPWHTKLCGLGVPRGPAVLLIYLLFATALGGLCLLVAPVLVDEISRLFAIVPEKYT